MKIVRVGIDIAKTVFQVHGVNSAEKVIVKKTLRRNKVLTYFSNLEPCLIGIEACGGAHYWARELEKQGHEVKLMAPQFVKPYIKGNKTDANDAEGICEAVGRPSMRFVSVKSIEQQDILMLHRIRQKAVKSRTALSNQTRGLLAEYGIVVNKGIKTLRRELPCMLEDADNCLSSFARKHFHHLYEKLIILDDEIAGYDKEIKAIAKESDECRRLLTIPGVGVVTATALVAMIGNVSCFKNGRELSAYFGLVPRQHSSGGKTHLQGISKRGDTYIRTLLIHGARSVVKVAHKKTDSHSQWINELEARRGHNKAAVAQANKAARQVWAVLSKGEDYKVAA